MIYEVLFWVGDALRSLFLKNSEPVKRSAKIRNSSTRWAEAQDGAPEAQPIVVPAIANADGNCRRRSVGCWGRRVAWLGGSWCRLASCSSETLRRRGQRSRCCELGARRQELHVGSHCQRAGNRVSWTYHPFHIYSNCLFLMFEGGEDHTLIRS
jgi:hypothetical protein